MKILILLPMYKIMDAESVQSLVQFQNDIYEKGDKLLFVYANGFNAAKARNELAQYATANMAKDNYDVILWLDSDHIYQAKDFYSLYETMKKNNLKMLSASYQVRGGSLTAHGKMFDVGYRQFTREDLQGIPKGEVVECDVVGFGFLLMDKFFLQDVFKRHGFNLFVLDNQQNITEDVQFCTLIKKDGVRICFDPNVRVGHMQRTLSI